MSKQKAIPEVRALVPQFLDYFREHPAWGCLHVMFDDCNWDSAEFCLDFAIREGDERDVAVAEIATKLSRSQRIKLERLVREAMRQERKAAGHEFWFV
jgi:hypothetical protein